MVSAEFSWLRNVLESALLCNMREPLVRIVVCCFNTDLLAVAARKPVLHRDISTSPWRNGLARWTSNPEVPGSSPGGDVFLF